jgi:2-keto-3-deoxy-L-rhamnonate aldolase RhmA
MPPLPFTAKAQGPNPLFGVYLMFPSALSAHIVGSSGFDWTLIDMEHSPLTPFEATAIVQAIAVASHNKTLPVIRTPSHGVEYIKWALDSGASGIIVPMVQSKAEMMDIVRHARYPPFGQRSFGPFNAPYADLDEDSNMDKYFNSTAKDIALLPMIESAQGVVNAEEIMSVPGISGVFVGPVDLRLSMGLAGPHGEEKEYLDSLKKIADIGKQRQLPIGIFAANTKLLPKLKKMGFSFFLVGGDVMCLAAGLKDALVSAKQGIQSPKI